MERVENHRGGGRCDQSKGVWGREGDEKWEEAACVSELS